MNKLSLSSLSRNIATPSYGLNPAGLYRRDASYNHISDYITPAQFERWAHDVSSWRAAIREAEWAFYPQRVKMMRMYIDTVENIEVKAVLDRLYEICLQRDILIYQIKNGEVVESKDLSQQLESQRWFRDYRKMVLDATLWGFTLIELGDIVEDSFPNITFTRRQNLRPDGNGEGPVLTSMIYGIDGLRVESDPLIAMCNHWIGTPSNIGVSKCGYGLLYNIAYNEIHLRHIIEWNVDYIEMYGQPTRVGKTTKTGAARKKFEQFLRNAGQDAYIVLDNQDSVEFVDGKGAGTAWKCYENLENRLKAGISKLVLGHEDAISATAGKLGGQQAASKDGFHESLIEQAIGSKQVYYGNFECSKINEIFAPKMRALGKYVGSKKIADFIPEGYYYGLKNDREEDYVSRRLNSKRTTISTYVKNMNDAGWDIDKEQLSSLFGMKLTASVPERKLTEFKTTDATIHKPDDDGTPFDKHKKLVKPTEEPAKDKKIKNSLAKDILNGI